MVKHQSIYGPMIRRMGHPSVRTIVWLLADSQSCCRRRNQITVMITSGIMLTIMIPSFQDPDIVIDRKLLAEYEAEQFERGNYDPYPGKDIDL